MSGKLTSKTKIAYTFVICDENKPFRGINYKCSVKLTVAVPKQKGVRVIQVPTWGYSLRHVLLLSKSFFISPYFYTPVLKSVFPLFWHTVRVNLLYLSADDNLYCLRFYSNSLTAHLLPRGNKTACLRYSPSPIISSSYFYYEHDVHVY